MRTLVLLLPNRKPAEVWRKGLNYAKQYDTELVALVLIDQEDDFPNANDLVAKLLNQAKQEGIAASSEIALRQEDFDIFAYKDKFAARLLIM